MIETTSFRLRDGVSDDDFVDLDARLQIEFAYAQPGLHRRTMTRVLTEPGRWQEFVLWASIENADAAHEAAREHPVVTEYSAMVDHATIEQHRFDDLG